MKLQFRHRKFQADAAKAVCDVFAGQPYQKINVEDIFKLPAPNTSVRGI
jgi:restriction endonuclease